MRRSLVSIALVASLLEPSCRRGGSSQRGTKVGFAANAGMVADPARGLVYIGDPTAGRVLALQAKTGDQLYEALVGGSIGGLALDECADHLYVAVPDGSRIDVFSCDTFTRTSTLRLGTPPFALAPGVNGHLLAVTGRALIDLDPVALTTTTLKPAVDLHAHLCSDRWGTAAWLAESSGGEIVVSRFDLTDLSQPPIVSAPASMFGEEAGIAASFDGSRFYVATNSTDGVYVLDGATLAALPTLPIGPGLAAVAVNSTGTRMTYTDGTPLIESINLDQFAPGHDLFASTSIAERGLIFGSNNQSLLVHGLNQTIAPYDTFAVHMDAPASVRQGHDYTMTIDGAPGARWLLFASLVPGYTYIDPPTAVDPRFLDIDASGGLTILISGTLDASGHDELSDTIPTGLTQSIDVVLQIAQIDGNGKAAISVSNPIVVRFLDNDCP